MLDLLKSLLVTGTSLLKTKQELALENLALRQQLAVLNRSTKRPKIKNADRAFWVTLKNLWSGWSDVLFIVKPETVINWHRKGFKLFWRWKSRKKILGRPRISCEIQELIRKMSSENGWRVTKIHGELLKLGYVVSQNTVEKYMVRPVMPPSQTWRTFLSNHAADIVACDFFTVPTATIRILFVFFLISHDRRKVLHFNVTDSPSAEWTAQQVVNAFPYDSALRFLLRDRDRIYGSRFRNRVKAMGIEEVITARKSPWPNPYAERAIGSFRRECLDHCIILNEAHLIRIFKEYIDRYYNPRRTHIGLDKDCPIPRPVDPPENGNVVSLPILGGLHHRYFRKAA
jgi:putative transposase